MLVWLIWEQETKSSEQPIKITEIKDKSIHKMKMEPGKTTIPNPGARVRLAWIEGWKKEVEHRVLL